MPHLPHAFLAASVLLTLPLCGCGVFSSSGGNATEPRPYPVDLPVAEVLDIQLFRDVTELTMTNTTPTDLGPATLWLNKRFALDFESFPSGETISLPLDDFRDEFGDHYRAGGFFATRNPDPVLHAQIEQDGELLGVILVRNRIR